METAPKVGPVGKQVAENVKTLRSRIPVRELSARLESLGRPILPSGITKIEQGARRVDVDDLVALADALDASPLGLLLPNAGGDVDQLEEWEQRGVLSPILDAVRVAVVDEGVPLDDLLEYVRLAYRMRSMFEARQTAKRPTLKRGS